MLLVDVLTGLGGALQENQQPAVFLTRENAAAEVLAAFCVYEPD